MLVAQGRAWHSASFQLLDQSVDSTIDVDHALTFFHAQEVAHGSAPRIGRGFRRQHGRFVHRGPVDDFRIVPQITAGTSGFEPGVALE